MKRPFLILLAALLILGGFAAGVTVTKNLLIVHWDFVAPDELFNADPPLPIPALKTMTAGAETNAAALASIVAYYQAHETDIGSLFREQIQLGCAACSRCTWFTPALCTAWCPHCPANFIDYIQMPTSACGTYSYAEGKILTALGVQWRSIDISGGTHTFVEANIDGHWEYFDATINVWVNRSALEMQTGVERTARKFYTPLLDPAYAGQIDATDLRVAQELRVMMPGLKIYSFPKRCLL